MDNITHSLVGLMLARAGLNRGVKRTTLMLILASSAPDIDVVSWFGGPLTYLAHHREFTHALLFSPLLALLPWAQVRYLARAPLGWFEYGGALIAVLLHV